MIEQYNAFDARVITETRISSLRSRAIRDVRCITAECGLCYVQRADDLRWDDASHTAQARIGGVWLQITPLGLQDWAQAEHLQLALGAEGEGDALYIASVRADLIEQLQALDDTAAAMEAQIEQLQARLDGVHAEIEALQDELGALPDDE